MDPVLLVIAFIILLVIHFYLFVRKNVNMRVYGTLSFIAFMFVFMTVRAIKYDTIYHYVAIFITLNLPAFIVIAILRPVMYFFINRLFDKLVDKCIMNPKQVHIERLSKLLLSYFRGRRIPIYNLNRLRNANKTIRKNRDIPYETREKFRQVLVLLGVIQANEITPRFHENVHTSNSRNITNDFIIVAENALNEAKNIVKLAPNACVFSCRKYTENITKFMVEFYNINMYFENEGDNFANQLHALQEANVIEDKDKIGVIYNIKDLGNDAAHKEIFDVNTAKNILDETIMLHEWFRATFDKECA